jgi:aspartyl-tRNA(Asn)/glutamyl-tRNA(Gln) amidotransferase subunit C
LEEKDMAQKIDHETIENVCILAKLALDEKAKETAKEDMQKMLDYVEKLNELDTDGVEPLTHIFGSENVFREDVVTNGDQKEAMLANAPQAKEWQYQVPKTIG